MFYTLLRKLLHFTMRKTIIHYVLWLSVFFLALTGCYGGILTLFHDNLNLHFLFVLILVFSMYLISAAAGVVVVYSNHIKGTTLLRNIMGVTVVKFFLYILILVLFIMLNKSIAKQTGLLFIITYFAFTIFEKIYVIKVVKTKNKPETSIEKTQ